MGTNGLRVENYLSVAVDLSEASDEYFSTFDYLLWEGACCIPTAV